MGLTELLHSPNVANIQVVVSAKDLQDFANSLIAFATRKIKEQDEPTYYTREELAEKLHISLPTLNRWRDTGLLPEPVKMEGRVLYDKAKVRDLIDQNYKLKRKLTRKNIAL